VTDSREFDRKYFESRYGRTGLGRSAEQRRAFIYKALIAILRRACSAPAVVVEVGCGVGYLTKHLARIGGSPFVISTDISADGLHLARSNLLAFANVALCRADAEAVPCRTDVADVVVAFDVIEHLPHPDKFFAEARRVLRPNGILMLSTPNPHSLGHRIKGHFPEWRGRPYKERALQWFGFRDDTHISIRSIEGWRQTIRSAGFTIVRDGTDFWWDTPYVGWIPGIIQKVVFNGTHRIVTILFGFLNWRYGENYLALCRRVAE